MISDFNFRLLVDKKLDKWVVKTAKVLILCSSITITKCCVLLANDLILSIHHSIITKIVGPYFLPEIRELQIFRGLQNILMFGAHMQNNNAHSDITSHIGTGNGLFFIFSIMHWMSQCRGWYIVNFNCRFWPPHFAVL